jgi:hypothetical protein
MDIITVILVMIGLLFAVVLWQSRKDTPRPKIGVYTNRFSQLLVIFLNIFKNIGVCLSDSIRSVDWDLTKVRHPPPEPIPPPSQSASAISKRQNSESPRISKNP